MDRCKILAIIIFALVCSLPSMAQGVVNRPANSGKTTKQKVNNKLIISSSDGEVNGQEYIDLGLPSGNLWASCDLGADSPEQNGMLFAWGAISPTAQERNPTHPLIKYFWVNQKSANLEPVSEADYMTSRKAFIDDNIIDGQCNLTTQFDAANHILGNNWRIPSKEDFEELFDNTKYRCGQYRGVNGTFFTSKINNKTIFFPNRTSNPPGSYITTGYWTAQLDMTHLSIYYVWMRDESYGGPRLNFEHSSIGLKIRPVIFDNNKGH